MIYWVRFILIISLSVFYFESLGKSSKKKCRDSFVTKRIKQLQSTAEQGDAEAQYKLGFLLYQAERYTEALHFILRSARNGNRDAEFLMGSFYKKGFPNLELNPNLAFNWFLKAAQQEHLKATNEVGYSYFYGEGVEKDKEQAIYWLKKAANQGFHVAMYNLGVLFFKSKDKEQAIYWLKKAIQKGNKQARELLQAINQNKVKSTLTSSQNPDQSLALLNKKGIEHFNQKDLQKAREYFLKAAEQGLMESQYNVANLYKKENHEEAFKWFERAAEQGHAESQNELGFIYFSGENVRKNYEEAFKWFERAAEQGLMESQYNLGSQYFLGKGVKKNYEEAFKWFERAAEQGHSEAQFSVGLMHTQGIHVEKNHEEAFKWFLKAAKQGHIRAQITVSIFYQKGKGVKQSEQSSLLWFEAFNNNPEAKNANLLTRTQRYFLSLSIRLRS